MKLIIFNFLICLAALYSCNYNKRNLVKSMGPASVFLDSSKLAMDTNNLQINKIDSFNYVNLSYWDSTMDRFYSAYVDTFTVDGNPFRFINPTAKKAHPDILVYLEKQVNKTWIYIGFTLSPMNFGDNFDHSRDINGDGFIDITQDQKWDQEVYFYDTKNKTYHGIEDTNSIYSDYINYDWALIDTTNKIFCDFSDGKLMCHNTHSTLYTFDGFTKRNLYDLELYNFNETNLDTYKITRLILSKIEKRKFIDKTKMGDLDSLTNSKDIVLPAPIDINKDYNPKYGYFDYVHFWKKRYKALLGIH